MTSHNEFKETEIGDIPVEWEVDEIENAFEFSRKPRSLEISDEDIIPFIPMDSISEVNEDVSYHEEKKWDEISSGSYVEKDDLIVAKITPSFENGKQALLKNLPKDFGYATTEIWALHPKQERKVETDFLYNFLKKKDVRIDLANKMEGSTGRQRVPRSTLAKYKIPIPPLPEQKAIAQKLTVIRNAIKQTQAVIEATEELKKSMMKHLFTYGPVPADQTDRVELKETDIGLVPEGWRVEKIGEVTEGTQYGISQKGLDEGAYPVLRMNNLVDGFVDISDVQFLNLEKEEFEKYKLKRGDILFNRTNSFELVGKTSIFDSDEPTVFASYLVRIKPAENGINPWFLNYYLNWNMTQARLKQLATRAVSQSNINATKLRNLEVAIPSKEIQHEIVDKLNIIQNKIWEEKSRLESLQILFNSTLESLMSAKLRVN